MQTNIHFFITSRSVLLRMRNVSDKSCTENQSTHFVFSNVFFQIRTVYEIMWKNIVEQGRTQMTIWRMRIACWIPKATNTHSEYVTPIAFPPQQWLQRTLLNITLYAHCLSGCVCPYVTHTAVFTLRSVDPLCYRSTDPYNVFILVIIVACVT